MNSRGSDMLVLPLEQRAQPSELGVLVAQPPAAALVALWLL